MKLSDLGEFGFLDRIAAGAVVRREGVVQGIGDDCAVVRVAAGKLLLVTADLLVERVHFLRGVISPRQLGAKALAVNLSDIASMGGAPKDAYVSVAIPSDIPVEHLDEMYAGMKAEAARYSVNILGGDTTGSKTDLVIDVALTGEVDENAVLYRSGARPGDALFVTGFLGDSRGGLDAITRGVAGQGAAAAELARRHHEPTPHVREGQAIAATGLAHAMIDVSDGLASDLAHICERSGVGAEVDEASVPISPELAEYCRGPGLNPRRIAVSGGEDYVLLVAADPALPRALAGVTLHRIGTVVEKGRRELIRSDGGREPLAPTGWDHFRAQL